MNLIRATRKNITSYRKGRAKLPVLGLMPLELLVILAIIAGGSVGTFYAAKTSTSNNQTTITTTPSKNLGSATLCLTTCSSQPPTTPAQTAPTQSTTPETTQNSGNENYDLPATPTVTPTYTYTVPTYTPPPAPTCNTTLQVEYENDYQEQLSAAGDKERALYNEGAALGGSAGELLEAQAEQQLTTAQYELLQTLNEELTSINCPTQSQ